MRSITLTMTLLVALSPGWSAAEDSADPPAKAAIWYQLHTPISDAFRLAFDTRTSSHRKAWRRELEQHYRTDGKLVFRGVCDAGDRRLTDFLHMFVQVSDNLLSKNSGGNWRDARASNSDFDLRRSIFADFSRFNRDAYRLALYKETLVHQVGPVGRNKRAYRHSYGFSTSWSFWMAAEFAGVYPGDEPCANSMVFGMYPAQHFLDYATLEAVDSHFKRLYPDEREVLGTGGADPDSLMLAARLETRKEEQPAITEVLLRDPRNPSQVWYFTGSLDLLHDEVGVGWSLYLHDITLIRQAIQRYGVEPPTPPSIPADSALRVPPSEPLVMLRDGEPAVPDAVLSLDYDLQLYPRQSSGYGDAVPSRDPS